jgi:hypothetical protein
MRAFPLPLVLSMLLAATTPAPAGGAEPWETAVVEAVTAMNRGDGDTFVKWSHKDFNELMRMLPLQSLKDEPESRGTKDFLAQMAVKNIAELEALDTDTYVRRLIPAMHNAQPPAVRDSMKEVKIAVKQSASEGDLQRVTVELTVRFLAQPKTMEQTLYAKREGDEWKYYGDAKLLRRKGK